ncbi:MAG: esterase-like activity of phytase family protein [Planctomycetota bacterium]
MRNLSFLCVTGALMFPGAILDATPCQAEIKLQAQAQLPGDAADKSGLNGKLAGGIPHNQLGGFSAIAYSGRDDIYWLLSDRGPADGATKFSCRVHKFKISPPTAGNPLHPELLETVLLTDPAGQQLVGSATEFDPEHPLKALRFDPEGLRLGRDGSLFLSEEYAPHIAQFSPQGKRLQQFPLPPRFGIKTHSASPDTEGLNTSGRQPNAGPEALAIVPDGSRLVTVLQRALIQDHGKRGHGENVRIVEIPLKAGTPREFIYRLDSVKNGVNEIVAINDHEFLVLERDGEAGNEAKFKKIMRINLYRKPGELATDVSHVDSLPDKKLPDGIHHVKKEVFLDLLDPKFGLKGEKFPEKHEGICFGPRQGQHITLITVSDNDFKRAMPSTFQMFSISAEELPDFVPQQFDQ